MEGALVAGAFSNPGQPTSMGGERNRKRTACGVGWRLLALLRHFDIDIGIGTQSPTATPPGPAHPLDTQARSETLAAEAGGAFGARAAGASEDKRAAAIIGAMIAS